MAVVSSVPSGRDWIKSLVGGVAFDVEPKAYVASEGTHVKAVVSLPRLPAERGVSGLADYFRVAGGIAARGCYSTVGGVTVDSSPASVVAAPVVSPAGVVESETEAFPGDDAMSQLLRVVNAAAEVRGGATPSACEKLSGLCYLAVLRIDKRRGAASQLGQFPTLASVLSLPRGWFIEAERLAEVGVSMRDGYLHLEVGYGKGRLTALDLFMVARRLDGEGDSSIMTTAVGGSKRDSTLGRSSSLSSSSSSGSSIYYESGGVHSGGLTFDCRGEFLRALDLRNLAVYGRSIDEVKLSPGWGLLASSFKDDPVSTDLCLGECGLDIGAQNRGLCASWAVPIAAGDKVACSRCGFFVTAMGHAGRCNSSDSSSVKCSERDVSMAQAWLGDALHVYDVRRTLLASMPYADAVKVLEGFVAASAQAKFLKHNVDIFPEVSTIDSTRELSTWFESRYVVFRRKYLEWLRDKLPESTDYREQTKRYPLFGVVSFESVPGGSAIRDRGRRVSGVTMPSSLAVAQGSETAGNGGVDSPAFENLFGSLTIAGGDDGGPRCSSANPARDTAFILFCETLFGNEPVPPSRLYALLECAVSDAYGRGLTVDSHRQYIASCVPKASGPLPIDVFQRYATAMFTEMFDGEPSDTYGEASDKFLCAIMAFSAARAKAGVSKKAAARILRQIVLSS